MARAETDWRVALTAKPRATICHPSAVPIKWNASTYYRPRASKPSKRLRVRTVKAKSWFDARDIACRLLKVEPGQLILPALGAQP